AAVVRAGEGRGDRLAGAFDAADGDLVVAQGAADVAGQRVVARGQRALHVDLQQEVHAAAQVQAEVHGAGLEEAERSHPGGRGGYQVQRDGVVRIAAVG